MEATEFLKQIQSKNSLFSNDSEWIFLILSFLDLVFIS